MASTPRNRLSTDATELAGELGLRIDGDGDCDVLVVGSGYGGAVAALRLAESGRFDKVWLVERGIEHLPGSFPASFAELPGELRFSRQDGSAARGRMEGLFDVRLGDDVSALLGNGLGGGSLINAGVMVQPKAEDLQASGWPKALWDDSGLGLGYQRALDMLAPELVPPTAKARTLGAMVATDAAEPCQATIRFHRDRPKKDVKADDPAADLADCTLCGDCLTGCNIGAKKSLDTSYLLRAWQSGARLFCGVTVVKLEPPMTAGRPWRVHWHFTAPDLRPDNGPAMVIRARHVVLAAGALGSTEILLRSRNDDMPLSSKLGTRFSTNGDQIMAVAEQSPVPLSVRDPATSAAEPSPPVGPTISARAHPRMSREKVPTGSTASTIEEFAVPAPLQRVFAELVSTLRLPLAHATDDPHLDPLAATLLQAQRAGLYGLMGDDGAAGRLVLPLVKPGVLGRKSIDGQIRIDWPSIGRLPLFADQLAWMQTAVLAAPGRMTNVITNPGWIPLSESIRTASFGEIPKPNLGGIVTVHPLGGCPIGDDATHGVVDDIGRVYRPTVDAPRAVHHGLAVLDGAIAPGAIMTNPALTITALAERALPHLIAQWSAEGQRPAAAQRELLQPKLPGVLQRSRSELAVAQPASPTQLRFSERLWGPLRIDGTLYWAELALQHVQVNDLAAMLRAHIKPRLECKATLCLWSQENGVTRWDQPRREAPLCRVELAVELQLFVPGKPVATGSKIDRELVYDIEVTESDAQTPPALQKGKRLKGVKLFGKGATWPPKAAQPAAGAVDDNDTPGRPTTGPRVVKSLIRQLCELPLYALDASGNRVEPALGMLELDFDDLADRGVALLEVTSHSSAPDHLLDLAGLGLFALRHVLKNHPLRLLAPDDLRDGHIIACLSSRWPGTVAGISPVVVPIGPHGARLSRYRVCGSTATTHGTDPMVLVHGYGASGTTFTHPSIPVSMVKHFTGLGRDVWVLDLRSSIANEPFDPRDPRPGPWSFDEIAREDIPAALRHVVDMVNDKKDAPCKVDLVVHCIGAGMACLAMLEDESLQNLIGCLVLSQVGPVMRMGPLNRFRGAVAQFVERNLDAEEFDVRPEFKRRLQPDGSVAWQRDARATEQVAWLDTLLAAYPYPSDEDEEGMVTGRNLDFRRVRRRADIIFGHLMELARMDAHTLENLDAINGWVKVRSFAQTIHWARHGLLLDRKGRGQVLSQKRLASHMKVPVLLLHGLRNRVFDWHGSLQSYCRLARAQGIEPSEQPTTIGGVRRWGKPNDPVQLRVFEDYGHQDCLIGRDADRVVFREIELFLAALHTEAGEKAGEQAGIEVDTPAIGPIWGALQRQGCAIYLRLVAHPRQERQQWLGWLLVPDVPDAAPTDALKQAVLVMANPSQGATSPARSGADDLGLHLQLDGSVRRFRVLTVHGQLAAGAGQPAPGWVTKVELVEAGALLQHGVGPGLPVLRGLHADDIRTLRCVQPADGGGRRRDLAALLGDGMCVCISPAAWKAAMPMPAHTDAAVQPEKAAKSDPQPVAARAPLSFVVGSCQYPPGVFDQPCAEASYAAIDRLCDSDRPPQFMLALGDQVYVDSNAGALGSDAYPGSADDAVRQAYDLTFRMPAFRRVTARLPMYMMLDDHEVRDNWQPLPHLSEDDDVAAGLRAFDRYQGVVNPVCSALQPGRHFSFRPAGALVAVLDTRSQRDLRRITIGSRGTNWQRATIIAKESMRGLKTLLCQAPDEAVKFIASPSPLIPFERAARQNQDGKKAVADVMRSDGWAGYPDSMDELLEFIVTKRLRKVVFLSGDAHLQAVCRVRLADDVVVHGVLSSGLYAPWPFANADARDYVQGPSGVVQSRPAERERGSRWKATVEELKSCPAPGFAVVEVNPLGDDLHGELKVRLIGAREGDTPVDYTYNLS